MIFDNMNKKYIVRLLNLFKRYENEISDIYKLVEITKYPKGKFEGLDIEKFSKFQLHQNIIWVNVPNINYKKYVK